jgi:ribonuclease P/MRP protein subunit POP7
VDFRKKSSNEILKQVEDGVKKGREEGKKGGEKEEVVVKGTGKAISKVVSVAAWFQDEGNGKGVRVRLRTGSVGAVDDVVPVEKKVKKLKEGKGDEAEGGGAEDGDGEEEEDPETQVRRVSCLEVGISLR